MKYTEEEFIEKVKSLYNGEIEVIGRFKGLSKPIVFKNKYGICSYGRASELFRSNPSIKCALNKTEYFMNQLKDLYPEIAEQLVPKSEYISAKQKMLFENKFGLVSTTPDTLLAGHCPNIRSAINRKEYFKNQLLYLYDNEYEFEITSTDRHKGRVVLICPIHGKQSIDSDGIFLGKGCPHCNTQWTESNVFYLIRLYDETESFYKLGISYINSKGVINRFKDYKKLKYNIEEIKIINFDDFEKCRDFETKMKHLIKQSLYMPKRWEHNGTTECFTGDLIEVILNNIKNYDIVSTSNESLSNSKHELGED